MLWQILSQHFSFIPYLILSKKNDIIYSIHKERNFKMKRSSGVLMHVSTLFGDYSIGSFGENARYFIDFLEKSGFSYWQVLPFYMADEYNSPYQSYSAFSANPYFIDLDILEKKNYISKEDIEKAKQETPYSCEYDRLKKERLDLLFKASLNAPREEINSFIEKHPYVAEFCKFMALKQANDEKPWIECTTDNINEDILFMWKFIQYEFFTEWQEIKEYANSKNIKIIGDIPIYVAYDSSDVYFHKELFQLDKENIPTAVAGVPPDYFCADGQLWGNPLYDWDKMEADDFKWWKDRLTHMLSLFDGVRIDHFRGLESYWSVPYGAKTARDGKWEKAKGEAFIDAIKSVADDKLIIAEDLGDITEEVEKLVDYSGFPGMKVFQFGFLSDGDSPHKCHNYKNNSIAYTGTHDNNTLLGYVWELDDKNRKNMLEYCGYFDDNWDNCYDSIIRTIFSSSAGLIIFPVQDLLLYGSDTRLNVPGRAEGNWAYRITKEQLDGIDTEKYKKLNKIYNR